MATVGLKYPIYAPLTETDGSASYSGGKILAKAIKADLTVEIAESILYADDSAAESSKEFRSGRIAINVDDIPDEARVDLYGHKQELAGIPEDNKTKMLVSSGTDDGKYVGFGFYCRKKVKGVTKWRAIWLTKIKFGVPNESWETKGENIVYQTPTTEGTIMLDVEGNWKKEVTVDSEAKAKVWLNSIAGIA